MRFADYNGIKFVEIRLVELKIWILQNYTEAVRILVVSEKLSEESFSDGKTCYTKVVEDLITNLTEE
jgi:hypothetical protein